MRILITGGAGFVGSSLALMFKRDRADAQIRAFDNLRRRGSELALERLRARGVEFVHGDVRSPDDLADAGAFDLLLECSAEPSVHAGYQRQPGVRRCRPTSPARSTASKRRGGTTRTSSSSRRAASIRSRPARAAARAPRRRGSTFPTDASGAGWSRAGHLHGLPAYGLPLDVRRDQARLGAAHRRVPGDVRAAHDREPLRRDLRSLADGQGRSGVPRAVGGAAPLRRQPRPTSGSAARASRSATCCTSPISTT